MVYGNKKYIFGLLAVLVLALWMSAASITVYAAGDEIELPDLNRTGSITIRFTIDDEPFSDGNKVALYKVADVVKEIGFYFVYRKGFESAGEVPENLDEINEILANKLAHIADQNSLVPDCGSQELDSDGTVTFEDLSVGLYLVVQTYKSEKELSDGSKVSYTINPFLVTIPQDHDGKKIYDIVTNPKVAPVKEIIPTPTPTKPNRLPQTGQLWVPVMVLGVAGFLFIIVGLIRRNNS